MSWAQRLKRVFSIDIETCRRCGGRQRVIASIEEPAVIERILDHLGRDAESIDPAHPLRVESVYPHVNGNLGWDWSNFYVTPDDPKEKPFSFKILFLWEKVNGEWWYKGDFHTMGRFGDEAEAH